MKKFGQIIVIVLLLVAIAVTAFANDFTAVDADTVRRNGILKEHVAAPFPDPESAHPLTQCWGKATFALAAFATNQELTLANQYVEELAADFPVPMDETWAFPMKFPLPLLLRAYLDPIYSTRMSDDAKSALETMMWNYVFHRSKKDDAHPSVAEKVWQIHDSENLDIIHKVSSFLIAQSLRHHPGFNTTPLADGYSLENHYTAWAAYLKEWMRQRARNGLTCEIASPSYAKYTLHTVYMVCDYSESNILAGLAKNWITLFWADVAQDFLPATGVRGGAQTRAYKDANMTDASRFSLRTPTWMYGWHHNAAPGSTHPMTLGMATSRYEMPDALTALATTTKRGFQSTTRRFGLGTRTVRSDGFDYTIEFAAQKNAGVRRDTYTTDDYVLGTLTVDPTLEYTHLNGQNRWMGAVFGSEADARLGIVGRAPTQGDGSRGRAAYFELTGVLEDRCLIAGRDPNAYGSVGTDISYAGGLWDNWRSSNSGWFFTQTDDTFVAVRVAAEPNGAGEYFDVVPGDKGVFLELHDAAAPVIVEVASRDEFEAFTTRGKEAFQLFKESVAANILDVRDEGVRYVSEDAHTFDFFKDSFDMPAVDGKSREVNPDLTWASPYLNGWARSNLVIVSVPGFQKIKLDFGY